MLEIGCNVVVLSLDQYEELKAQARAAEAKLAAIKKGITFRVGWSESSIDASIGTASVAELVEQAWNDYVPNKYDKIDKAQYRIMDRENWYSGMGVQMAELIPQPEELPEGVVECEPEGDGQ